MPYLHNALIVKQKLFMYTGTVYIFSAILLKSYWEDTTISIKVSSYKMSYQLIIIYNWKLKSAGLLITEEFRQIIVHNP